MPVFLTLGGPVGGTHGLRPPVRPASFQDVPGLGIVIEDEHGLQVVLRDGARVTKVGPYDGHLTNDADVLYER